MCVIQLQKVIKNLSLLWNAGFISNAETKKFNRKKNIAVKSIYGIFSIASFMCIIADGFTFKGGFS